MSAHVVVQLLDDDRRQAHRELVDQEHRGIGGERAGHREHLLLAARERAGGLACRRSFEPGELREGAVEHVVVARAACTSPCAGSRSLSGSGRCPRPSGMRQTPARASASGGAPVTSRPHRSKLPDDRADLRPTRRRAWSTFPRRSARAARTPRPCAARGRCRAARRCARSRRAPPTARRSGHRRGLRRSGRVELGHDGCFAVPRYARCTDGSAWISAGVPLGDDASEVEHVDVTCTFPSRAACRARPAARRDLAATSSCSSSPSASVSCSSRPDDGSSSSSTRGAVAERAGELRRGARCRSGAPRPACRRPPRCRRRRATDRRSRGCRTSTSPSAAASRARRARSRVPSGCRTPRDVGTCARCRGERACTDACR